MKKGSDEKMKVGEIVYGVYTITGPRDYKVLIGELTIAGIDHGKITLDGYRLSSDSYPPKFAYVENKNLFHRHDKAVDRMKALNK